MSSSSREETRSLEDRCDCEGINGLDVFVDLETFITDGNRVVIRVEGSSIMLRVDQLSNH